MIKGLLKPNNWEGGKQGSGKKNYPRGGARRRGTKKISTSTTLSRVIKAKVSWETRKLKTMHVRKGEKRGERRENRRKGTLSRRGLISPRFSKKKVRLVHSKREKVMRLGGEGHRFNDAWAEEKGGGKHKAEKTHKQNSSSVKERGLGRVRKHRIASWSLTRER